MQHWVQYTEQRQTPQNIQHNYNDDEHGPHQINIINSINKSL